MRVALLSSTSFGYQCLEHGLLNIPEIEIAAVLTTESEINISYSDKPVVISAHAKFDDLGAKYRFPVITIRGKISGARYIEHLAPLKPDLLIALGWYYMIPQKVRQLAPLGCAGIHASLLPKYRGGAPISWAIINGESETGVTFFYFEDGVDTGDIIAQEVIPIDIHDTNASVYEKATAASIRVLRSTIPHIARGTAPRIPQDHAQATQFPQRSPKDGLIDWQWSAKQIYDFIRAQTRPYPGAYTFLDNRTVSIWVSALTTETCDLATGTLVLKNDSVKVCCGDRHLLMITDVGTEADLPRLKKQARLSKLRFTLTPSDSDHVAIDGRSIP